MEGGKTVLGLGPGLGRHAETQDFIRKVVAQTELPVVLDADGLNAFAGSADALRQCRTKFLAITPHPGEMGRLLMRAAKTVQEDRVKTAQEAAQRWNAHVILKGSHTVIASPDGEIFINTSGNPGLAKGCSCVIFTALLPAFTAHSKTNNWTPTLAIAVNL